MFGRAVDVVSRNAVNPDFLPDEDKSTPQLDLWLVSNESYRCGSTKSAPIWGGSEQQIAMPIWHS